MVTFFYNYNPGISFGSKTKIINAIIRAVILSFRKKKIIEENFYGYTFIIYSSKIIIPLKNINKKYDTKNVRWLHVFCS